MIRRADEKQKSRDLQVYISIPITNIDQNIFLHCNGREYLNYYL